MIVYRKSIELVCILHKQVMPKLEGRDRELHQQLHRAVRSVVLNSAEARSLRGKRRTHHFSIALGSAREAHACLELAMSLGFVAQSDELIDRSDHIQAMLYKLTH